jgi:hypothetical protein
MAVKMNYWLLTCNPKLYPQVFGLLEKNGVNRWAVSAHKLKIRVGDKVALWIGGNDDPGIYMFAEIGSAPYEAKHFNIKTKTTYYVRLRNSRAILNDPILVEELASSSGFKKVIRYIRKSHMSPVALDEAKWNFISGLAKVGNTNKRKKNADEIEKAINHQYRTRPTHRNALIQARIGQGAFRKNLLRFERKCRITGITNRDFLIASHIKPWANSTDKEKLDINNGLLLSPNLDRAFDKGLISFDAKGRILISRKVSQSLQKSLGISKSTSIGKLNFAQQRYMKYHRDFRFKKAN